MGKTARPLSESNLGPTGRSRGEILIDGRQDSRRIAGKELAWFQQAIAHSMPNPQGVQDSYPCNEWFLGDSMTENYGVTDDYHSWVDLVRSGQQRRVRSGGLGYIPARHAQGITWPYAANPDAKNIPTLTAGALTDNVDYGFGFGRRDSWMANGATYFTTVDCDRFWVHVTNFSNTYTVTVDAGTPNAQSATITPTAVGPTLSNRIYDSLSLFTNPLALGMHTITLTATTSSGFFDGLQIFYTDATSGVHTFNGGHSGYQVSAFDGSTGPASNWADLAYQPYLPTAFADGVGNGTTTFTSATATFTDLDIGSYIVFVAGGSCTNGMARIVARGSGTSVTLDRVCASASGIAFQMNRAQVTDAVITINTTTMTSATAAFNPWDVGCYLTGPTGMPTGTYIARWNSATSVELSNAATATQSAQTVRFMGRQARWCAPDLIVAEFGINDMNAGVTPTAYKASIRAMISLAIERVGLGFPVGSAQRFAPSVVLLGMWAPGTLINMLGTVTTVNGNTFVTSETFDFDPVNDVGKTITTPSNTPIPAATTLISDPANTNRSMKMSAAAIASSTVTGTIVSRRQQEKHWMPFRQAMFELASENTWRFFDLYSLGGYIGATDPLGLTFDLTHPNNHGAQWIANEMEIVLIGQPNNSAVPQGIIDAKGDLIVGLSADVAAKVPAGNDNQIPVYKAGSNVGVIPIAPSAAAPIGQIVPTPGGTGTILSTGLTAPTLTATAGTSELSSGTWLTSTTSAVSGNPSGIISAFNVTRFGRLPEYQTSIAVPNIASIQVLAGLFSASPDANPPAAAIVGAYFRYNTTSDGTVFWRCCVSNGTTLNVMTTTQPISTVGYDLRIETVGVIGSSISRINFYINSVLVAWATTNLPSISTALGWGNRVMTLTTATKQILTGRCSLVSGP